MMEDGEKATFEIYGRINKDGQKIPGMMCSVNHPQKKFLLESTDGKVLLETLVDKTWDEAKAAYDAMWERL